MFFSKNVFFKTFFFLCFFKINIFSKIEKIFNKNLMGRLAAYNVVFLFWAIYPTKINWEPVSGLIKNYTVVETNNLNSSFLN